MTDTSTMTNVLDRLAERVEKAAAVLQAQRIEHAERTLNEAEVQAIQDRMVEAVSRECSGQLRER